MVAITTYLQYKQWEKKRKKIIYVETDIGDLIETEHTNLYTRYGRRSLLAVIQVGKKRKFSRRQVAR